MGKIIYEWTPIDEGLPEKSMFCLLTIKYPKGFGVDKGVIIDYFETSQNEQMELFNDSVPKGRFKNSRMWEVVAWLPLPEAYGGNDGCL